MSGLLLGAIACSEESDNIPTPSPAPVTSGVGEPGFIVGFYNIQRFEQDGVENHELKEQMLDIYEDGRVAIHGRNYLYEGRWTYNEEKEYFEIDIPGDAIQAVALSSPSWIIGVNEPGMLILVSNDEGSVKRMVLRLRTRNSEDLGMTER
jgi:hypothetical protein